MKSILLALAALGLASSSSAAEVGLGVSLKQNENTLYLPVKVSPGFRIEGSLFQSRNSMSSRSPAQSGPAFTQTSSFKAEVAGVGLFWLKAVTDNSSLYFGPRLGYISQKYTSGIADDQFESRRHGYQVSPTLGFEYFPIKHMSLGAEVAYNYTSMSGSATSTVFPGNSGSLDSLDSGTVTAVMVRFYF
jgi:hypothetical protein